MMHQSMKLFAVYEFQRNMLMVGEPGCGKTMIAQRFPTILPEMTEEECLEVTKLYSISGLLPNGHALMKNRPFRAPYHNVSLNALIAMSLKEQLAFRDFSMYLQSSRVRCF